MGFSSGGHPRPKTGYFKQPQLGGKMTQAIRLEPTSDRAAAKRPNLTACAALDRCSARISTCSNLNCSGFQGTFSLIIFVTIFYIINNNILIIWGYMANGQIHAKIQGEFPARPPHRSQSSRGLEDVSFRYLARTVAASAYSAGKGAFRFAQRKLTRKQDRLLPIPDSASQASNRSGEANTPKASAHLPGVEDSRAAVPSNSLPVQPLVLGQNQPTSTSAQQHLSGLQAAGGGTTHHQQEAHLGFGQNL